MATPIVSVREYCTLLVKSKLLPPDEVERLHARWTDETRGTDDRVDSFPKFLVARRALTEYQAALIQRGRAENFFLDGYKILDRIGKGQMGGVYKAVHNLGQVVALKILPASRAREYRVLSRFQREARLLTQLDHPNIVRAFQVGDANGVHFIAMEYLDGETLDDVLARRKRLPWAEAVRIVDQALGGLQHLHERRTIHRDLKPANLMLTPAAGKTDTTWDATVKILDIGLGRELFDDDEPDGTIETQLTDEGAVLGTPDYLSPEQARDASSADIRADIYSLGCVLFHSITGRPLFPETNIMAQLLKHATEKPTPLADLVPDVPAGLQAALDGMLAKSPNDRFATPALAAAALRSFLGKAGTSPSAAAVVPEFKKWLDRESEREAPKNRPAKPAKSSDTAPSPALAADNARTKPSPALAAGARTGTAPAPALPPQPPIVDEVNVELVAIPAPVIAAPAVVAPDQRGWLEFNRRDWILLAAGAASVLAAVGAGYGLARLMRKTPEETPPEE